MTELIANHIESFAQYAHLWGFLLIFFFMTVESSFFIPFPSEVVMIPAGFLAVRGELLTGNPWIDATIAVVSGTLGSLFGAYINYFIAVTIGRTALYKYGKYFFLPEKTLVRAENFFREYGDIGTFVCRLLPGIRQVISLPAGLAKMNFARFSFFTALGAGIWVTILTAIGAWIGHLTSDLTYVELVHNGEVIIRKNFLWLALALTAICVTYLLLHKKIMKSKQKPTATAE
jgi:membrane protein DedA with SNARE-associated domain